ncbi:hypothetical protein NN561_011453 [Cricetulus griseus]
MQGTASTSLLSPAQRLSPSAPRTLTSSPSTLSKLSPQASLLPPLQGAGEPTVPAPGPGRTTKRTCTRGSQEPALRRRADADNREQRSRPDPRQAPESSGRETRRTEAAAGLRANTTILPGRGTGGAYTLPEVATLSRSATGQAASGLQIRRQRVSPAPPTHPQGAGGRCGVRAPATYRPTFGEGTWELARES